MEQCAHHVESSMPSCDAVTQVAPQCKSTCQTNSSIDYSSDKNNATSSYGIRGVDKIKQDIFDHGTVVEDVLLDLVDTSDSVGRGSVVLVTGVVNRRVGLAGGLALWGNLGHSIARWHG